MKRVNQSHLPVAALSHPGMRGKNNEDRYAVTAFELEDGRRTPALLAVLADGIGGHRAGEVAAEIAVNQISAYVAEFGEALRPEQMLQAAVRTASQSIFEQAHTSQQREGMGATCACAFITGNRLYTVSVGDSRIYLLRGGKLQQLTTDHTWIHEAIALGVIKPEEAAGHPNAHVIRQFLGSPYPPAGDIRLRLHGNEKDGEAEANQGCLLEAQDVLLLTTDGLTDLVNDDEIAAILKDHALEPAAQALIDLANARGGHDNITVIAIRIPRSAIPRRRRWLPWLLSGCLTLAILAAAILGAVLGVWEWDRKTEATPTPALTLTAAPEIPGQSTQLPTFTPAANQPTPVPGSPTPPVIAIPSAASQPAYPSAATYTPWPTNTRQP